MTGIEVCRAYDERERRIGRPGADWASWYANYLATERTGLAT
jgi:hypothetical protein